MCANLLYNAPALFYLAGSALLFGLTGLLVFVLYRLIRIELTA